MASMKEHREVLLKQLSERLVQIGFDKKIHGQSFWKFTEYGRTSIHLGFINHVTDFDITVSVGIRIDKVEDMANASNKLIKDREKKMTCTIGTEIGNFINGRQKRWTINNFEDIGPVCDDIYIYVMEVAVPYIEKYSELENVYEVLLRDDKEGWRHAPIHYHRAICAVAMARLLGKSDYKDIVDKKTKFLKEREDYGLPLFLDFINKLDESQGNIV
ncbi:hypothetical protein LPY66_15335 [Dehalobacter sp. DCM]|uniref:hypothetical protein n=1 Tax=Dehalobacter sp. DCM TaxID=2907827 RepID=UPI003081D049|nr:hypothetical protein LPY66_15335 [Dehalobacter sp. DCM]